MDFLFWLAMMWVLWYSYPEWKIWWNVYQWKRKMRKDFDDEWNTRQRSGSDDAPTG
jgi:hypothetical protein